MKRDFLRGLDLADDVVDKIMAEYGKSVNTYKESNNTLTTQLDEMTTKYNDQQPLLDTLRQENDQLKVDIETANQERDEAKLKDLKLSIALENNIPYRMADRIKGSTEDELRQDAKSLSEFVGYDRPQLPPKSTEGTPEDVDPYREMVRKLKNKGDD